MKKMMNSILVGVVLLAAGSVCSAEEPSGLQVEITPYLWLAGLEGDAEIGGEDIEFDKSASDLLDALELGGSLLGVVQYNRFLFWGQVDYFSFSTDALDVEDRPQRATLDTTTIIGSAAVGYQFDGWAKGQRFDVLVGARYLELCNDLSVDTVGNFSRDHEVIDPILVIRPYIPLFPSKIEGLAFNPTFVIGGGGDSELVYEFFPQIEYRFAEHFVARLGYRTAGWKFEGDRGNELDIRMAGPVIGIGVTF